MAEPTRLRVVGRYIADQWFPFERLTELRCYGPVRLEPEVAPHCLRTGIALHWFAGNGDWLGLALPAKARTDGDDIERLLTELTHRADWQTRLSYFVAAEERNLMLQFLTQSQLRVPELRTEAVRAHAESVLKSAANLGDALLRHLRQALIARTAASWAAAQLPAALVSSLPNRLAIPAVLARLADWELLAVLWRLRHRIDSIWRNPAHRLAFLEANLPDVDRLLASLMRNFKTWVQQQHEE